MGIACTATAVLLGCVIIAGDIAPPGRPIIAPIVSSAAAPAPHPVPVPMLKPHRPAARPLAEIYVAGLTPTVCRLVLSISDIYAGHHRLLPEEAELVEDAWRVMWLCQAFDGGRRP